MKKKAVRNGSWFRILSKIERSLVDLVIRIVGEVRSALLARLLNRIVWRLLEATEGNVTRLMKTVGVALARKASNIGRKLGYSAAKSWATNRGFVQFLTILYLNNPTTHWKNAAKQRCKNFTKTLKHVEATVR